MAPQIRSFLDDPVLKPSLVLLVFGNVDLHVHFLYQWISKPRSDRAPAQAWAALVWEKYKSWLEAEMIPRLAAQSPNRLDHLFIATAVLPCVSDAHLKASATAYTGLEDGPFADPQLGPGVTTSTGTVPNVVEPAWPSLPTIEERTALVESFNTLLRDYCSLYRLQGRLHVVDINPSLAAVPAPSLLFPSGPLPPWLSASPSTLPAGSPDVPVHRAFLDHIDLLNIHPVWERTVPLYLQALSSILDPVSDRPVLPLEPRHVRVDLERREATWLKRGRQTSHIRAKDLKKLSKSSGTRRDIR